MSPAATSKTAPKKRQILILKLSASKLSSFPHTPAPSAQSAPKSSASSSGTPIPKVAEPTPAADTPVESTATPSAANGVNGATPSSSLAPPPAAGKRKSLPAPRGTKRGAGAVDGMPKPRGKPGPKKKQKMGDMINDPNNKPVVSAAKLGPKANQGAINAGLRALDRTGKPCRKWQKRGFQVRSFTGVNWNVPTWRAPKNAAVFGEDVKSETTTSSDPNVKDESSAISDRSGLPVASAMATPAPPPVNGLQSSPAPVAAAS